MGAMTALRRMLFGAGVRCAKCELASVRDAESRTSDARSMAQREPLPQPDPGERVAAREVEGVDFERERLAVGGCVGRGGGV